MHLISTSIFILPSTFAALLEQPEYHPQCFHPQPGFCAPRSAFVARSPERVDRCRREVSRRAAPGAARETPQGRETARPRGIRREPAAGARAVVGNSCSKKPRVEKFGGFPLSGRTSPLKHENLLGWKPQISRLRPRELGAVKVAGVP